MQLAFQFCPVASPLRSYATLHHQLNSSFPFHRSSIPHDPSSMDASSRNRMPAPNVQQKQRQHASNLQSNVGKPTSVGEVNGRVDQLALVQQALQDGATPTIIAGFAMILAQMQAQAAHLEVLLTITSSIRPLERSATFSDGARHGYDLTRNLIDPRSHMIYGEPNRPSMDQETSFRISPPTIQPLLQAPQPHQPKPPASPQPTTFNCTLPLVPPPILTPPMPLASESQHSFTHHYSNFMLLSAFQGEGCK